MQRFRDYNECKFYVAMSQILHLNLMHPHRWQVKVPLVSGFGPQKTAGLRVISALAWPAAVEPKSVNGNRKEAPTMTTTPIKERAPAFRTNDRPEHTVDTDLPQELTKLPDHASLPEGNPSAKGSAPAPYGGCQKMAASHKRKAEDPASAMQHVLPTTGLVDEGHPTILAPTRV